MSEAADLQAARKRATHRRAAGVASDFDPSRLALGRRLAGLQRTWIARAVGVTPAAITQYEKGQIKPTLPVVEAMCEVLGVPPDFFRAGYPVQALPASSAHFRSLRSTSSLEREKALAFAELTLVVLEAVERYVELPAIRLPDLDVSPNLDLEEVVQLAQQARARMGLGSGPVPHMVRLLEAHGVAVVRLDDATRRVDAFSHQSGSRPLVLLNPLKGDKARSRFDAAHELGHLLMHHDTEPGSRLIEDQAHAFAAEFLAPAAQIGPELPARLDWSVLHTLKRRWGVSLRALVVRTYKLGRFGDTTYQRAMRQLSSWGLPEPGPLGPPEAPVLIPRAVALLDGSNIVQWLTKETGLPADIVIRVLDAAGSQDERPPVNFGDFPSSSHTTA
ncbi:helix-turn-helix domain-containing protein [Georgenia sp. AZ-5]|uniref:helix-turn-helix domain-containing protein n=1 Tax=Georgenia sp. AZ-5 TaxID=3367526 RepID=UPI0037541D21